MIIIMMRQGKQQKSKNDPAPKPTTGVTTITGWYGAGYIIGGAPTIIGGAPIIIGGAPMIIGGAPTTILGPPTTTAGPGV